MPFGPNRVIAPIRTDPDGTFDSRYPTVTDLANAVAPKADSTALNAHINNTGNPHTVTKAQLDLGNVDNTSDAAKPISTAVQAALDGKAGTATHDLLVTHIGSNTNPHAVTKAQLGLGNVDNTADTAKPVSTAQRNALNLATGANFWGIEGGGAFAGPQTHGYPGPLTTKTLASGRMYLIPLWIPTSVSVKGLRIEVTTAVAASGLWLGLYNNAFSRIISAGSVSAATPGMQSKAFPSLTLAAGRHYLAILPSAAGIAVRAVDPIQGFLADGAGTIYGCSYMTGVAFTDLPATASRNGNDTTIPNVLLETV